MSKQEILLWAGGALAPILASLVAGKFLRRLVLAPFKWAASKTENKFDDQLEKDAEHDLGLDQ